jgi:AcrR family transcriptional regulator
MNSMIQSLMLDNHLVDILDMNKKTDQRIIKTKRLIKTTFLGLLTKYEYDKITISLIAREARIDRKTFYMHYSNTKELLEEFGEELLNKAIEKVNQSPEFDIQLLFKTFNEIFRENEYLFEKVLRTKINDFLVDLIELRIIELLRQKILKDYPNPPLLAHYHLKFITTGLIALYIEWLNTDDEMDINQLADVAVSIVSVNFDQLNALCSY